MDFHQVQVLTASFQINPTVGNNEDSQHIQLTVQGPVAATKESFGAPRPARRSVFRSGCFSHRSLPSELT